SACAFLLVGHQVQDLRWLAWLTWLFVALGAVYIAGRALPILGPLTSRVFQPGADTALFWIWLTAMAGGQALFNRALGYPARLLLGAIALATLCTGFLLVQSWISGWLPSLVALVALVWLRSWRLGLLATFAGIVAVQLYQPDLLSNLVTLKEYSTETRQEAWQILFGQIIPASPILGLG